MSLPGVEQLSTVLIAEDEVSVRWLIRMTLDTGGFEIIEVEDGYAAIDAVRRKRPALIFLDWTMPGMTGLEVCRAVRADPAARDTKIVMLTAHTDEQDRADAMEAGVDDYITKPFSPRQLLEKVNDVLGPEAVLGRDFGG
jgi:two-component system, OmpR family, phosphate regulon response regulator PhoB